MGRSQCGGQTLLSAPLLKPRAQGLDSSGHRDLWWLPVVFVSDVILRAQKCSWVRHGCVSTGGPSLGPQKVSPLGHCFPVALGPAKHLINTFNWAKGATSIAIQSIALPFLWGCN